MKEIHHKVFPCIITTDTQVIKKGGFSVSKKIVVIIGVSLLITGMLFTGVQSTVKAAGKLPKPVISLNQEKVSIAEQAKPDNTGRGPYFEFSTPEDIASISTGRIKALKVFENYPDINTKLNGAQTGEPLQVKSLDGKPNYYIIPFIKKDQYVGSATVYIIDGKAMFGSLADFDHPVDKILPVSIDEATSKLKSTKGFAEVPKPILVYKTSKLSMDRNLPFWEFTSSDGINYYVSQDGSIFDKIETLDTLLGD